MILVTEGASFIGSKFVLRAEKLQLLGRCLSNYY